MLLENKNPQRLTEGSIRKSSRKNFTDFYLNEQRQKYCIKKAIVENTTAIQLLTGKIEGAL